ncbi:MAG: type III-B CRISPR module-associated protein Cmr5 [Chloracidobacterium sp.]|uniref:CRISPR type III-B/RAMP module-associated protein Cmr5 n=1 Tax=Chloracidobacterium validum TaxID=2821543 RepID=A0ABX8BAT6_9BACT|nr:type III-B CRISPR module-associated protein Cmr5 [Chloracidobacterium validum]QUW04046.1 type III-B CRISPR module-associated protein Cmr5 [Chloracidobacterium validum]
MQTRDQRYARRAYEQMTALPEGDRARYGALALKLPVLIRTAGLAQAVAFVEARGKREGELLLEHLAQTLGFSGRSHLGATVREAPVMVYLSLTRRTLAALVWYKRFAQSLFKVSGTEETDG